MGNRRGEGRERKEEKVSERVREKHVHMRKGGRAKKKNETREWQQKSLKG